MPVDKECRTCRYWLTREEVSISGSTHIKKGVFHVCDKFKTLIPAEDFMQRAVAERCQYYKDFSISLG